MALKKEKKLLFCYSNFYVSLKHKMNKFSQYPQKSKTDHLHHPSYNEHFLNTIQIPTI